MVACARSSRRPATARARTCASASRTWARRRCARPPPRRRCAGSRSTPSAIAAAAEQAAEGTEPPGRPQRLGGLQAPPGARADAGGRSRTRVITEGSCASRTTGGREPRPWPARATSPTGPSPPPSSSPPTLEQPLLLEGEAGVGKTEVAKALAAAHGRAADPAAVPRGHRPPPRALRLGLRAPAAGDPRRRGRAPRRASCSAASSCCAGRCWRRSSTTARPCC